MYAAFFSVVVVWLRLVMHLSALNSPHLYPMAIHPQYYTHFNPKAPLTARVIPQPYDEERWYSMPPLL